VYGFVENLVSPGARERPTDSGSLRT
jgi:hypothetical protein